MFGDYSLFDSKTVEKLEEKEKVVSKLFRPSQLNSQLLNIDIDNAANADFLAEFEILSNSLSNKIFSFMKQQLLAKDIKINELKSRVEELENIQKRESKYILKQIIDITELVTTDGGNVKNSLSPMEIIINKGAVKKPTEFSIKKIDETKINIPQNVEILSPCFELGPHSVTFSESVFLKVKLENAPNGLCLYKQENEENEKILNKWSIHFPKKIDSTNFKFELKSFCFAFMGKLDIGIDVHCNDIENVEFNNKFKSYQYIHAGLNYRINCENDECCGKTELMIVSRGFGNFQPNNDIDTNDYMNLLKCSICNKKITSIKSIKNIILFQSRGKIDFKVNKKGESLKNSEFHVNGSDMIIYGENEGNIHQYSTVLITVNQSLSAKSTGKNLVAGLSKETIETRQDTNRIEGFTTRLDLVSLEQVKRLVQRALNRRIEEAVSPNILDLAFCMDCTG